MEYLERTRNALAAVAAVALTCVGMSAPARADLIPYNDPAFGVGSAALDTATGLEWLNLRFTLNQSPTQVLAQLAPGGSFAGFRYATGEEFSGLTASYFGTDICCYVDLDLARTEAFATLLGPTQTTSRGLPALNGYFGPYVLASDDEGASIIAAGGFFYQVGPDSTGLFGAYDQDTSYLPSAPPIPTRGSFLVRAADVAPGVAVPEPASLALAGIGLAALALIRRRTG